MEALHIVTHHRVAADSALTNHRSHRGRTGRMLTPPLRIGVSAMPGIKCQMLDISLEMRLDTWTRGDIWASNCELGSTKR
jgi:hypothetical protein